MKRKQFALLRHAFFKDVSKRGKFFLYSKPGERILSVFSFLRSLTRSVSRSTDTGNSNEKLPNLLRTVAGNNPSRSNMLSKHQLYRAAIILYT